MPVTETGLRPIEKLDQEKINRVVAAINPLSKRLSETQWAIGDALLAEWPMLSPVEVGKLGHAATPLVRRYLEAVATRVGLSAGTLGEYRKTAAAWPAADRVHTASFGAHAIVRFRVDRLDLLARTCKIEELQEAVGRRRSSDAIRDHRQRSASFSNISKAAEAAIEVLADEAIPADKRVSIALNILVKFFEEAAA